jgi:hypothetical protein
MFPRTLGAGATALLLTALAGCGATNSAAPVATAARAPQTDLAAARRAPADPPRTDRVGPATLGTVPTGQRPPQIVVTAFDDSGDAITSPEGHYAIFDYWRQVSREYNARMTFFLTGLQLLTSQTEHTYDAPQLGPGNSHMGFAFDHVQPLPGETQLDAVRHEMNNLKGAYAEGNEIGTHFGGHICGKEKGAVGSFTSADWEHEVEQFNKMVDNANQTNKLDPPVNLGFTSADIVGSRTPCLEGNFHNLYPVLTKHGYTYDTSPTPDTRWPQRGAPNTGPTNLWVFPLATVPLYGTKHYELSMDWNICAYHDPGCEPKQVPAASADQWSQQTLDTLRTYFEKSYAGDRAPLFIGYHPEMWHHGAYTKALAGFLKETCNKPEVRCVSYGEVAGWLNKDVPAAQLTQWRDGDFPHYTDPKPPAYGTPVSDVLMPKPWTARPESDGSVPQPSPAAAGPQQPGVHERSGIGH